MDADSAALYSVVLPVYNGEHFIERSVDTICSLLRRTGVSFEVLVVNDGSVDNTLAKLRILADRWPEVRVLSYPRNLGKGFAFAYGARRASGKYVVLFDADLDVSVEQLLVLIARIASSKCDVVVTNKWYPGSPVKAKVLRRLLSLLFNALARLLTGINLRDTQTGAKAFKRGLLDEVLGRLYVKRYAFDVELLLAISRRGGCIDEVPAIKPVRLNSSFKLGEILKMFLDLIAIAYRFRVQKVW